MDNLYYAAVAYILTTNSFCLRIVKSSVVKGGGLHLSPVSDSLCSLLGHSSHFKSCVAQILSLPFSSKSYVFLVDLCIYLESGNYGTRAF